MATEGTGWGQQGLDSESIPYYGRLSRPIEHLQPQHYANPVAGVVGVSPIGEALKDFGNMVTGATKYMAGLADVGLTKIAEDTYAPIANAQQQQIHQLKGLRDQLYSSKTRQPLSGEGGDTEDNIAQGGNNSPPSAGGDITPAPLWLQSGTQPTGGPAPEQPLDKDSERAVSEVSKLRGIMDSKGMSQSQYLAQKNKILFDTRARIPMTMRSTFDSKIAEIEHANSTANQTVHALSSDINKFVAQAQKEQNQIVSRAMANLGDSAVAHTLFLYQHGRATLDDVFDVTAKAEIKDKTLDRAMKIRSYEAQGRTADKDAQETQIFSAKQDAIKYVAAMLPDHISNIYKTMKVPEEFQDSPEHAHQWILNQGPETHEKFKMLVAADKVAMEQEASARFARIDKDTNGRTIPSLAQQAGDPALAKTTVAGMSGWHDAVVAFETNKDISPIHLAHRVAQMTDDQVGLQLMNGPDRVQSAQFATAKAISSALGPNAAQFLTGAAYAKLGTSLGNAAFMDRMQSVLPNPSISLYGDTARISANGKALEIPEPRLKQAIDTYPEFAATFITNKDAPKPNKENVVNYAYSPKNAGFITAAKGNGLDYFSTLYNPEVTKTIKDQLSPQAWDTYKNSFQSTFTSEVMVPIINKINTAVAPPSLFPGGANVGITFDDESGKFALAAKPGSSLFSRVLPPMLREPDTIRDLNRAYEVAAAFATADGQNPKEYMFSIFHDLGLNNETADMFSKAIGATKKPKPAPKPASDSTTAMHE